MRPAPATFMQILYQQLADLPLRDCMVHVTPGGDELAIHAHLNADHGFVSDAFTWPIDPKRFGGKKYDHDLARAIADRLRAGIQRQPSAR